MEMKQVFSSLSLPQTLGCEDGKGGDFSQAFSQVLFFSRIQTLEIGRNSLNSQSLSLCNKFKMEYGNGRALESLGRKMKAFEFGSCFYFPNIGCVVIMVSFRGKMVVSL